MAGVGVVGGVVLAGALVLGAAGTLAEQRGAPRGPAVQQDEQSPVWIGRVTGHFQTAVRLDVEGVDDDAFVVLARITNQDTCRTSAPVQEDYERALVAATPVGSTIAVVRSRHPDGAFREEHDQHGFVHPVLPDGRTPDLASTTVNERLVLAGVARPEPAVDADPEARAAAVARARSAMSAQDHDYWLRFVAASDAARRAGTGQAGVCARADQAAVAAQAEIDRQTREREDEDRRRRAAELRREASARAAADDHQRRLDAWTAALDRWLAGRDGRQGTADDAAGPSPEASEFGIETSGGGGGRSCDGDGDGVCYE